MNAHEIQPGTRALPTGGDGSRSRPPRIDVVICTYNNACLLENTLESLARQKAPDSLDWSVMVVDNACSDDTPEVVEAFRRSGRIPRIHRVYESEQGLVPARIRGIRETSAPWIAFVDDDCLLDDMWLASAAAFIESHPECGGFGGIVRLHFESSPPQYVRRYGYSFAEQEHGNTEERREWLVGAGMVLNRNALLHSGWMERQYLGDRKGRLLMSGGDMEMVLRIRSAGYELWYTPNCVIRHVIQSRRTTPVYLSRLNRGLGVSQTWCDFLVWSDSYLRYLAATLRSAAASYWQAFRQAAGILLRKRTPADFRITLSFANGRIEGLAQIVRLKSDRRRDIQGCARPGRKSGIRHVALLHWGDLIEDFLDEINVTLDEFRDQMTGGWMFGYIRALRTAGIDTTLICVSARVRQIESWTHRPTGADICILPASRLYRRIRAVGISPAVWKKGTAPNAGRFRRRLTRLFEDILPYLATPVGFLRRELKNRRIDAILCQDYEHARFDLSLLAGTLNRIPVFATFQGGETQFSRVERLFRRTAIRKSAGLIIGSSRERDRVRSKYGVPDCKIAHIFNPLDLSLWYAEDRRNSRMTLELPENALLVMWHGRIDVWRKGLDILIDGWKRLMRDKPDLNAYLVLIGNGPDSDSLRQLIESGHVPRVLRRDEYVLDRSVMRRYLSAGDVYVFTSRHEGFPVAPLEAMACGLPVVATDCHGIRDILTSGRHGGFLVPAEDSSRLAQTLATLLDNEVLRTRLSCDAKQRIVENFSLQTVGSQLRDFLAASAASHS